MRRLQALACIALVASLSGCFLLPTAEEAEQEPQITATQQAERMPEVGDCWTADYTSFLNWTAWKGDDAVDCGDAHQSYTFAISTVFEDFDDGYPLNGMDAEASTLAYESCNSLLSRFLEQHLGGWPRLETYYFGPSAQQWRQGERWLRCDLVVMELGSSLYESTLADLPEDSSELVDALAQSDDYFDLCVDTEEGWTGWGPLESESAVYSNCSVDPMWRLHGFEIYPGEWEAPYPGAQALEQFVSDECLVDVPADKPGYSYYPDEDMWDEGDRSVTCWTYEWEAPDSVAPPV